MSFIQLKNSSNPQNIGEKIPSCVSHTETIPKMHQNLMIMHSKKMKTIQKSRL